MGLFSKNLNLHHPLLSSKLLLLLLPLPLLLLLHLSFLSTTNTTTTTKPIHRHRPPPPACNYSTGKWVPSSAPLLYNGTSCSTIKDRQNCMAHGRPDTSYLRYRWRPSSCPLPRFHPPTLLRLLHHKHIAFVGDSMARNQLESLLCLLSSRSLPSLLHGDAEDKNRRWIFPSHNVTVSVHWSPFLVRGVEKGGGLDHNELHFDAVDERWAADVVATADVLILSAGHWFLHPAVYYDGPAVIGCHACVNHTEVGFYDVFRRAFRTALREVVGRRRVGSPLLVVVTTFSPAHFEGEWDKFGACARTEPDSAAVVGEMEAEMRRRQWEEAAAATVAAEGADVKVEVLDVTPMAAARPDGHPGAYMYAYPFRDGTPERVQNDCVHWCMPGPIDAWNEVLLQMVRRWQWELRERGAPAGADLQFSA